MRVFASLPVPETLSQALRPGLPDVPEAVRAIPEERWHLTLAFYGDVDEQGLACLEQRLRRRLQRQRVGPISVAVQGGGVLSGQVGYLAVPGVSDDDDRHLRELAITCYRTGRACDAPGTQARYRFRSHITVARPKSGKQMPETLGASFSEVSSPSWLVDEVRLVRSVLGPQPQYTVLERFTLAG